MIIRRLMRASAYLSLSIGAVITVGLYLLFDLDQPPCDVENTEIRNGAGDEVTISIATCSGFGTSRSVTIGLQPKGLSCRRIFTYAPGGREVPDLAWSQNNDALRISIPQVDTINFTRERAGNIKILYNIGRFNDE